MVKRITEHLPIDKPFLLLEGMSKDFIKALRQDPKYLNICPRCGIPISHSAKAVYIAVTDAILCASCADKWLYHARWYSEEEKTERCNYEAMVQKLKDSELWQE